MKILPIIALLSAAILFGSTLHAQQPVSFQPEDVLQTIGGHQLKYKHILAYVDLEMAGEDPKLLEDPSFVQELTVEAIEEFADAPEEFLTDMEQHYQVLLMEGGNREESPAVDPPQRANPPVAATYSSQWQQLLSGSVLFQTITQGGGGLTIQVTELMHLCPDGVVYFYQRSGGGGGPITAGQQVEFTGSANWAVVEQGEQAFLQLSYNGTPGNFPMRIINQKVVVEGLGALSIEPAAAQCQ